MILVPGSRATPPGTGPAEARRLLWAAGVVEIVALGSLAWWPGPAVPWPGLPLFAVAVLAYAGAAWSVDRGAGSFLGIWIIGIVARVVLVPAFPDLTDDFWRYLWDGYVQLKGFNPYLYAPDAPELEVVRTAWHALIANPSAPTIHPPVAQAAFLLVAWTGTGVWGLKLLWTMFDLMAAALLVRAARLRGRRRRLTLLLYLWSPLLLVESAWNAHVEVLGLFGLAAILATAHRPIRAGAATAWAALVKVAPLAAVPALASRLRGRYLVAFGVVTAVLLAPYASAGRRLVTGLGGYALHVRFNEGLFEVIEWIVPGAFAPRIVAGLFVLAVVAWATYRRFNAERALIAILGTGLLLAPALYPWYALWILPMAALTRQLPWLVFTCTSFIGYWGLTAYYDTGSWPQPLWARVLLWGPTLVLLVLEASKSLGHALDQGGQAQPHRPADERPEGR